MFKMNANRFDLKPFFKVEPCVNANVLVDSMNNILYYMAHLFQSDCLLKVNATEVLLRTFNKYFLDLMQNKIKLKDQIELQLLYDQGHVYYMTVKSSWYLFS